MLDPRLIREIVGAWSRQGRDERRPGRRLRWQRLSSEVRRIEPLANLAVALVRRPQNLKAFGSHERDAAMALVGDLPAGVSLGAAAR